MKAALLCVFVALVAAYASADCVYETSYNGVAELVNLTAMDVFDRTSVNVITPSGTHNAKIIVSPCRPVNRTAACPDSYAFVSIAGSTGCYKAAPTGGANGTTNATELSFAPTSSTPSLLLGAEPKALEVVYLCDRSMNENAVGYVSGSQAANGDVKVTLKSLNACPVAAPPAPPAPHPPLAPKDDGKGMSPWVIVGIIAAAVVVLVVGGIAFVKCRGGNDEGEGQYSRV